MLTTLNPFGLPTPFGLQSPFGRSASDNYVFGGQSAELVADHSGKRNNGVPYYRKQGATTTFNALFGTRYDRSDLATMWDSSGNLVWNVHNFLSHSQEFDNAAWGKVNVTPTANAAVDPDGTMTADRIAATANGDSNLVRSVSVGADGTLTLWAKPDTGRWLLLFPLGQPSPTAAWFDLENGVKGTEILPSGATASIDPAENGYYKCSISWVGSNTSFKIEIANADGSSAADAGDSLFVWGAHMYRSDLGGMAEVPADVRGLSSDATYLPTTSAARFLPRREAYLYSASTWVLAGLLAEPATTNLLLNTNTLSTQSATVTAVSHTLHFTGTGTITLSGASTAGPLVGAGTGEENRVSLVFTPSAGSLTLTVSGTVTNAQLETGVQTSYIPSGSSQAIRAADVTTGQVLAADMPYSAEAMWRVEKVRASYADNGNANEIRFSRWRADSFNYYDHRLTTASGSVGAPQALVAEGGNPLDAAGALSEYAPGVHVPMSFATRVTAESSLGAADGELQLAKDGVAGSINSTIGALPDLSSTDFDLGVTFNGFQELVMAGTGNPGEAGIEEASA